MKEGNVVAGTRTIPVVVKEDLVQQAEALCKDNPIVRVLPMPAKQFIWSSPAVKFLPARIKDGFGPVVTKKVTELGSDRVRQAGAR